MLGVGYPPRFLLWLLGCLPGLLLLLLDLGTGDAVGRQKGDELLFGEGEA